MNELTRELYGNIGTVSKVLFYLCAFASMAIFAWGLWRRYQLWQIGRGDYGGKIDWKHTFERLKSKVFNQRTVRHTKRKAGKYHTLLFYGFIALFIGTCLIAVEEWGHKLLGTGDGNLFHKGLYFVIYEVVLEFAGLLYIVGCTWFLVRMLKKGGGDSVGYRKADFLLLSTLLLIGVTGFVIEGFRIIREATPHAEISFVGWGVSQVLGAFGVNQGNVLMPHFLTWWFHSLMVFGFIATLPFTRLLHIFAGSLNLCLVTKKPGHMLPISMEELEKTGKTGVEHVQEFTRLQLLSLDACVACGRCTDACPATEAGKPLWPMAIVQDIRSHLNRVGPLVRKTRSNGDDETLLTLPQNLHGDVISAESLWSCTTCNACYTVCPLGVSPVNFITDMRRFLIGNGELSGPPAVSLQKVQRAGNPWGLPARERFDWAEGLGVPTVKTNPGFEVLYWIGCSASYDRRIQKVARSVVKLLELAGVNYATLGPEERCTGEFARRMGDEFLFQELAAANIEIMSCHAVKKIITHCPHCLNSLAQDYPQFGGDYEIVHHSVFLSQLIMQGKLKVDPAQVGTVTYHDPCYLSRVNNTMKEPRKLLASVVGKIKEMPRNRRGASCCGAGGGRMWFDDAPDKRIGRSRIDEAITTGADTLAVSCPFCLTMMSDGMRAKDSKMEVKDVAELLAEAIGERPSDE